MMNDQPVAYKHTPMQVMTQRWGPICWPRSGLMRPLALRHHLRTQKRLVDYPAMNVATQGVAHGEFPHQPPSGPANRASPVGYSPLPGHRG